jgi:predicted nuclease of predicted toxin-antitoxin system
VKLLCDEGVESQIVAHVRAAGHEVSYVAEMEPGISDDQVLASASEAGAVLVTNDKDFGELVFRQGRVSRASSCFVWPASRQIGKGPS